MNRKIIAKLTVPYILLSVGLFYVMVITLKPDDLIIALNSLFVGTMVSISITYGQVFIPAIFGVKPYDDVRILATGIFGGWLAYGLVVLSSIYVRAADLPTTTLLISSFGRWVAINSAVVQIIAPDFNESFSPVYGRDRRLLLIGLALGVCAFIAIFWFQTSNVLSSM